MRPARCGASRPVKSTDARERESCGSRQRFNLRSLKRERTAAHSPLRAACSMSLARASSRQHSAIRSAAAYGSSLKSVASQAARSSASERRSTASTSPVMKSASADRPSAAPTKNRVARKCGRPTSSLQAKMARHSRLPKRSSSTSRRSNSCAKSAATRGTLASEGWREREVDLRRRAFRKAARIADQPERNAVGAKFSSSASTT